MGSSPTSPTISLRVGLEIDPAESHLRRPLGKRYTEALIKLIAKFNSSVADQSSMRKAQFLHPQEFHARVVQWQECLLAMEDVVSSSLIACSTLKDPIALRSTDAANPATSRRDSAC